MTIDKYIWYNYIFEDNTYQITIAKNENEAINKLKNFNKTCIKIYESYYPNKIIYERDSRISDKEGQPQTAEQEKRTSTQESIPVQQIKREWDDSSGDR